MRSATQDDDRDRDRPTRRVEPEPNCPIRWSGPVRVFRALLVLQYDVQAGSIGGPNDGGTPDR